MAESVRNRAACARPKPDAGNAAAPRKPRAQIVIVDDHPVIREQLTEIINREADLCVCGEAATRQEALRVIGARQPDLAVVDLTLPDAYGVELVKDLQTHAKDVKILVLSMHEESLYGSRVIQAGARGYLDKGCASSIILTAIRRVLKGELYLSDQLAQQMASTIAGNANAHSNHPIDRLGEREFQVFERIGGGQSTSEIAKAMSLSVKTIETCRSRIKRKLNLPDTNSLRRSAIIWASRHKFS